MNGTDMLLIDMVAGTWCGHGGDSTGFQMYYGDILARIKEINGEDES